VVLPDPVLRLIMRILLRRKENILPDAEWEAIMKTQHHLDDFKAQKQSDGKSRWENMQLKARAIREYSGSNEDMDTVASIMCRVSAADCQTAQIFCLHGQANLRACNADR
jgi:hypothetical protein